MVSQFAYYRPRNIPGNYVVEVVLDLKGSETATVNVGRNRSYHCGSCGKQTPAKVQVSPDQRELQASLPTRLRYAFAGVSVAHVDRVETYVIGNIIVGDFIEIYIEDHNVIPRQATRHKATELDFTHQVLSYEHNGTIWKVVPLNLIYIIDRDVDDYPFAVIGEKPQLVLLSRPKPQTNSTVKDVPAHLGLLSERVEPSPTSEALVAPLWLQQLQAKDK